ncbi:MAG: desulfoferrodoxin [bacterium]|nr:desulfoferrodoxin [bacterium]
MTQKLQVFKCMLCGNIVEVLHGGGPIPVCCGETMTQLVENTVDAAKEKHLPVVEKTADGFLVKVGSVTHPMDEKHYIEWLELVADGTTYRKFLNPGDKPEGLFKIEAENVYARSYCNLHGFWKSS